MPHSGGRPGGTVHDHDAARSDLRPHARRLLRRRVRPGRAPRLGELVGVRAARGDRGRQARRPRRRRRRLDPRRPLDGVPAAASILAALWAVPRARPRPETGPTLSESDAPALWATVRELAAVADTRV